MPEHIPIAEAEHIAVLYNLEQVCIFARTPGEDGVEHLVTYGTDMENSAAAAMIGTFLKEKIMGWPAGDDAEVGEPRRPRPAGPRAEAPAGHGR